MNSSAFEEVLTETNGNYPTVSPSVRRIRTLKRRKEHERENSNKTQVRKTTVIRHGSLDKSRSRLIFVNVSQVSTVEIFHVRLCFWYRHINFCLDRYKFSSIKSIPSRYRRYLVKILVMTCKYFLIDTWLKSWY